MTYQSLVLSGVLQGEPAFLLQSLCLGISYSFFYPADSATTPPLTLRLTEIYRNLSSTLIPSLVFFETFFSILLVGLGREMITWSVNFFKKKIRVEFLDEK